MVFFFLVDFDGVDTTAGGAEFGGADVTAGRAEFGRADVVDDCVV